MEARTATEQKIRQAQGRIVSDSAGAMWRACGAHCSVAQRYGMWEGRAAQMNDC